MIDVKVTMPDLTIKAPDSATFWKRLAIQTQALIRYRTETLKVDYKRRQFKGYSASYRKIRSAAGRSIVPNLSFSTKMLASMQAIGKSKRGLIRLSGEQGFKAWVNELSGRTFFDVGSKDADFINKQVADEVAKTNKL